MFCKNCGARLPEGAVACPKCGQRTMPENMPAIENHLVEAILVTLFCCMPLGIVSIVYAAQVSSLVGCGNIIGAKDASQKAHKWAMISLVVGLVGDTIYLIISLLPLVFAGVAAATN